MTDKNTNKTINKVKKHTKITRLNASGDVYGDASNCVSNCVSSDVSNDVSNGVSGDTSENWLCIDLDFIFLENLKSYILQILDDFEPNTNQVLCNHNVNKNLGIPIFYNSEKKTITTRGYVCTVECMRNIILKEQLKNNIYYKNSFGILHMLIPNLLFVE